MSVTIKQLTDRDNKKIAGLTPEHAIYDSDGIRLDDKIISIIKGLALKDKSIVTRLLDDFGVTTDKLANEAIINKKIKDGTIELEKLSDNLRAIINAATGVPEDLVSQITKLMDTVFPLEVIITVQPTAIQRKNTNVVVTITWTARVDGQNVTPESVIIQDKDYAEAGKFTETINDTKAYTIKVKIGSRESSITRTVSFAYPIYTGFASEEAFAASVISKLTQVSLRTSLGTITDSKNNTSANNYYWIISPYRVNSVTTSGINIFSDFVQSTVIYDGTTYYCYRLSKASAVGSFTFTIS